MAHGHLREQLLLASARGRQDSNDSKVQCGVLADQVRPQCCTGQEGTRGTGSRRVARDCTLGMRGEETFGKSRK